MNHDLLRDAFYSSALSVYKVLYEEYRNESKAKKETFKIAKEVLSGFGITGDIESTYSTLLKQYKQCTDEEQRLKLHKKLEVMLEAIKIIGEEADTVGR